MIRHSSYLRDASTSSATSSASTGSWKCLSRRGFENQLMRTSYPSIGSGILRDEGLGMMKWCGVVMRRLIRYLAVAQAIHEVHLLYSASLAHHFPLGALPVLYICSLPPLASRACLSSTYFISRAKAESREYALGHSKQIRCKSYQRQNGLESPTFDLHLSIGRIKLPQHKSQSNAQCLGWQQGMR